MISCQTGLSLILRSARKQHLFEMSPVRRVQKGGVCLKLAQLSLGSIKWMIIGININGMRLIRLILIIIIVLLFRLMNLFKRGWGLGWGWGV